MIAIPRATQATLRKVVAAWRVIAVALVAGTLAIPLGIALGVRINISPSVPEGLWLMRHGPIVHGVYVVACLPDSLASSGVRAGYLLSGSCGTSFPVIKRVVAMAGDRVSIGSRGLVVNGSVVPRSRRMRRDSRGRSIAGSVELQSTIVRAGDVWLLGDNGMSWDSRYYGAVPIAGVVGTATPLIVRRLQT